MPGREMCPPNPRIPWNCLLRRNKPRISAFKHKFLFLKSLPATGINQNHSFHLLSRAIKSIKNDKCRYEDKDVMFFHIIKRNICSKFTGILYILAQKIITSYKAYSFSYMVWHGILNMSNIIKLKIYG